MRGDLAKIIYDAGGNDIEYLFGNSISTLQETEQAIEVSFQYGALQTFDLVIGADGLHSITRRLAFGDEHQFLHFLGGYLAVFTVPNYLDLHQRMIGFADVGRTAAIYPVHGTGQARVLFCGGPYAARLRPPRSDCAATTDSWPLRRHGLGTAPAAH